MFLFYTSTYFSFLDVCHNKIQVCGTYVLEIFEFWDV
jgi:hypothetical protein